MDLDRLIDALSQPCAYLHPVHSVEVRHTHISVVFLAGDYAYKVKKPVELGFLDFSTLEKRRHFCNEEVRLNRRLAANVYLGVVPVVRSGSSVAVEGEGEVVEWAVKMQRLPETATLESRLARSEIGFEQMQALARRIASFHAGAESGPHISAFGRFATVARNCRENFDQALPQVGTTISGAVYQRLRTLTHAALGRLRPLIERRAERGAPRDTHGDLRLEHVYLYPDRQPPHDLVVIDCIEFNERFRYADPVADMAFLVMDLLFHGRPDLARTFSDAYFRVSGDDEGRTLLPFYTAYRAAVRAKVEGFELSETEIPEAERAMALARARAHWLLAFSQLEEPNRKPCLVLVGGLPGTGKSTLSRRLSEQGGFEIIRSDVVRKELGGLPDSGSAPLGFGAGIYSPEWNERTYAECLRRARLLLFEGGRVLVDATFREEKWRRSFLEAATGLALPGVLFLCEAEPGTARARLQGRRNDVSDADWSIYRKVAEKWQELGPLTALHARSISTNGSPEQALYRSLELLRELDLHG